MSDYCIFLTYRHRRTFHVSCKYFLHSNMPVFVCIAFQILVGDHLKLLPQFGTFDFGQHHMRDQKSLLSALLINLKSTIFRPKKHNYRHLVITILVAGFSGGSKDYIMGFINHYRNYYFIKNKKKSLIFEKMVSTIAMNRFRQKRKEVKYCRKTWADSTESTRRRRAICRRSLDDSRRRPPSYITILALLNSIR